MQKAFRDIFEMLGEEMKHQERLKNQAGCDINERLIHAYAEQCYEFAIEIVNQVAEEYSHRNGDLVIDSSHRIECLDDVIERLQYKADNIKAKLEPSYFTECIDYLKSLPRCDDGWIPCSERLPEKTQEVLITADDNAVYQGVMANGGLMIFEDGWIDIKHVIAWQPLPKPYVKGE